MRIFPRRYTHRVIGAGIDQVLFGIPMPPGSTLNRIHGEVHCVGAEGVEYKRTNMYGLSGQVVPLYDLDDTSTYDTIWDLLVPKEEAETEGGFDLDLATDSQPEFQPGGELDWESIFEISNLQPREIYRRRAMVSVASNATGYNSVDAATDTYTPVDTTMVNVRRRTRVAMASVFLCGFSAPAFDQISAAAAMIVPTEKNWLQYKFLGVTLQQALISAIGLVASGTQEPYTEALAWLAELLEPNAIEDTGAAWNNVGWDAWSKVSFDITVKDATYKKQLSGG